MSASGLVQQILDNIISFAIALVLIFAGGWSVYALWDNEQIYAAASDVMLELLEYKPVVNEDGEISFEEILAINEDVCAWLTMDGTLIDYPVVQGETNITYLNMNVYGEFAISGAIFLDSRNSEDFSDTYSLVYGHHMANDLMFGSLDEYRNADFFSENTTGTLLLPDRSFDLQVIACIIVDSSDDYIFDPTQWNVQAVDTLLDYIEQTALCIDETTLANAYAEEDLHLLSLSTCASDYDDARTVVIAMMID